MNYNVTIMWQPLNSNHENRFNIIQTNQAHKIFMKIQIQTKYIIFYIVFVRVRVFLEELCVRLLFFSDLSRVLPKGHKINFNLFGDCSLKKKKVYVSVWPCVISKWLRSFPPELLLQWFVAWGSSRCDVCAPVLMQRLFFFGRTNNSYKCHIWKRWFMFRAKYLQNECFFRCSICNNSDYDVFRCPSKTSPCDSVNNSRILKLKQLHRIQLFLILLMHLCFSFCDISGVS